MRWWLGPQRERIPDGRRHLAYSPPALIGDLDPSNFGADSAEVDNPWFPLEPGTHYIWEGRAFDDEGNPVDRKVEFIATDLTKTIAGVRVAVGWDRDYNDDVLGESELTFYAQDRDGNVWHLGEYLEHYADGELDGARLWFPGNPDGAKAGIQMEADPSWDPRTRRDSRHPRGSGTTSRRSHDWVRRLVFRSTATTMSS